MRQDKLHTGHKALHCHNFNYMHFIKKRYRNHTKSLTHQKYTIYTELSKHVWHLKQDRTDLYIKCSVKKLFLTRMIEKMQLMFAGKT